MSKHYFTSIALKPIGFLTLFILLSGGIFAKTHDPPKKSARTGSVLAAISYSVQADPFPALTSVARRIFFDADSDGDIDMLYQTSTTNNNDIALKLNDGSGGFATTHSATNGTGTFSTGPLTGISFTSIPTTGLYALDYDKDGDTDLYEGVAGAAGRIIRNNGGSFSVQADPFPVLVSVARRIFFDADSDGDIDMLYQTSTTNNNDIALKLNDGSGGFATTHSATNGTGTFSTGPLAGISFASIPTTGLYALDYDKDGDTDLYEGAAGAAGRIIRQDVPVTPPTITSLSPASGPAGTVVTINGTNLTGTTAVVLRGIPVNITPISSTQVSFVVPAQASTGPVRLTTPGGTVLSGTNFTVTRASSSLTYTLRSNSFNSINVSSFSTPAITDLDHDGLIDLLVGRETGEVSHYEQSAPNSLSFTLRSTNLSGLTGHYNSIVSVTDIDGDGLLDMVVGSGAGNFKHYEQSAVNSTSFTQISNDFNNIFSTGGLTFQYPHFTDIDGDGLLDLLVGDEFLSRYEQTTPNGGTFNQLNNQNFGPTADAGNGGSAACVVDLDGDGLLDMLIGRSNGQIFHYEQTSANGTAFTQISTAFSGLNLSGYTTPAITDLDGDGLLDLLIGGSDGVIRHYEQTTPPVITSNPISKSVCAGSSTTFTVAASDATSYQWQVNTGSGFTNLSNNAPYSGVTSTTLTISNVAGLNGYQYRSVATGDGGSVNSDPATLTVNALPTAGLTNNGPLTCAQTSVTLTASGGNSYTFTSPGGSVLGTSGSTTTRVVSSPGTYSVTVANASGCVSSTSTTVNSTTAGPIATLSASPSTTLTCAQTSLTLTAGGGNAYAFSGPGIISQNGNTAVVNASGVYSVTVTNTATGCASTTSITINSNASLPTATISASPSTTLTCAQTSLTLTAGGGNAYAFSGPGVVSQSGNTAVVNASGVYSVTVTNTATGCASTTSITINSNASLPTATLSAGPSTTLTCAQTSLTLTAGGGNAYAFSGPGVVSQSGNTAVVNAAGVYSVTVTNTATGCASTTTITINSNASLPTATLSAGPSTTLTCAQTSLTLTAGGGNSYAFSGPGVVSQSGNMAVVNAAGVYSVTVTNTATGCASTTSITISQNANLPTATLSASPSTTLTCAQTSLTLTAGGGNAYAFSGPGVVSQSGNMAVVNASGVYSVTVTNTATGCFSTTSITINSNASLPTATLSASPSTTLTCSQTSLTLTAGGGNAYAFSGPGVVSQSGNQAVVNASGVYSVTVTNTATGCASTTSITINSNASTPTPTLSASPSTTLTCAQTSLTLTAGGGNAYAFSGPGVVSQSGNTAVVNASGVYSVTVTNTATGCASTTTITINSNASTPTPTLSASPSTTLTCAQTSLTLTAGGGNSYAFSGPGVVSQSGNTAVVNASGVYSVTVTNTATGCASTTSITINSNASLPTATLSASPSTTLTCAQTSLTLTAGGGNAYAFSGPGVVSQSGNTAVVNMAGVYSVTVTNTATGCASTTYITISQDASTPTATLSAAPSTVLTCSQTSLTLTAGGGNVYAFSPNVASQSGNMAVVNASGVYSVTVTNTATGCASTTSITINSNASTPTPTLSASPSTTLTCAQTSLTLTAGGGNAYAFSGPGVVSQSGNTAVVNAAGVYSVTVTNTATGCASTTYITISQDASTPTATLSAAPSTVLTCSQTSLTLTAGGGNVYAFSPNVASQSGNMAVVNASGVYSVTVTNTATGCASTTSITISQDNTALSASLVSSGNLSCAVTSVTLTASPNEQTYTFSTGATQIGSTNQATVSTAGMYSVTVLAGNGCSSVASVTVSQNNNAPSVSILANPSLTITQGQSATLTASVSGGTPPFGYGWSTTESTSAIVVSTPGPYSVTVTGANGCSATSSVTVTVNPVVSLPFAITGVTTVSCTPILPNRFSLSFDPRYQGLNGQPVSFSVTNELFPTTAPGPYTLQLYTDNPIITLEAVQSGVPTRYSYNWLDACRNTNTPNTPPRVVSGIPSQTATVGQYFSYVIPEGTFTDDETPTSLRFSATGLPPGLGFSVATLSGTPSTTVGSPFSVTITATDPGNLSVSTSLQLTVLPGGNTPPPTDVFSITGVTTISCTPVANRISLSFAPRYAGLTGQPIAFEVVNESIPTTAPAPYSLTLYRDNSVITLRANQTGSDGPVTFRYNWLDACSNLGQANTPPRLNEPVASQTATVGQGYNLNLSNTFTDQETPDQISLSASGLPAGLSVSGKFISGTPSVSGVSSVTLTATDGGGLSTNTSFSFTVVPAPVTPPPTAGFSITGVQTVNCEVLSAGQRRVTFSPQYDGLDGSPVSFSVLNELAPTTQPGPYVLNLYTDNPVITLSAVQSGLESRFSYGWLSACQVASPRVSAPVEVPLSITVLGNPVLGSQVDVDVRGAQGQELSLSVVDERGYVVSKLTQPVTAPVERLRVRLGTDAGVYYLQAQTATGSHTVKLVKQ